MRYKYLSILLFLFLPVSFISGQTLELYGKKVTFGTTFSEQKNNLWQDDGQIESEYSYIEIFEGDNITGWFYKNKLVTIDINTWSKKVCDEAENLFLNIIPYNQYTESRDGNVSFEVYKTNDFYICKAISGTSIEYTIVPIKILDDIRSEHPDYLKKLF
jgi:hypothetical protein